MSATPRRSRAAAGAAPRSPRPITHRLPVALAGIALALAPSACGSDPELTASVGTMVEVESALQCDITRFAHTDADAVEDYRSTVRQRFDVSADDHRIFLDMLLDDEELRSQVSDRTDVLCPPPTDTDETGETDETDETDEGVSS